VFESVWEGWLVVVLYQVLSDLLLPWSVRFISCDELGRHPLHFDPLKLMKAVACGHSLCLLTPPSDKEYIPKDGRRDPGGRRTVGALCCVVHRLRSLSPRSIQLHTNRRVILL
jgi:hypothetical protein